MLLNVKLLFCRDGDLDIHAFLSRKEAGEHATFGRNHCKEIFWASKEKAWVQMKSSFDIFLHAPSFGPIRKEKILELVGVYSEFYWVLEVSYFSYLSKKYFLSAESR